MLLLLHSMHLAMPRVRSFAFSSTLHEIGGVFHQYPAKQAMDTALKRIGGGSTNYGRAWEGFLAQCQRTLSKHSVLLVQGDGRNNYGDAKLAQLRQISRKTKAVF